MNNWLGLILRNGGNLILEINKTNKYVVPNSEDKWCNISLELKNDNVNLSIAGEVITTYEIKEITNNLKKVLENKINETIFFETLEQCFNFTFNKDNIRININFHRSLDSYSLYIDKYNIEKLLHYLNKLN